MVNSTQKLITVTDGVSYPVLSSTTYPISYTSPFDNAEPKCFRKEFYSDGTSYRSNTIQQTRTRVGAKATISNKVRYQYSFVDVIEIDIYNQPQTLFPYIIKDNSDNSIFVPYVGQIVTQLWSDGKTYSKTF